MKETVLTRRALLKKCTSLGARVALGSIAARMGGMHLLRAYAQPVQPEETASTEASLPNIIIINADDLGYGDVGCYGSKAIRTPNIDRMAQEGMKFTDFYASAAVCTPSRYGLLTGRYPARIGLNAPLVPTRQPLSKSFPDSSYDFLGKIGLVDINDAGKSRGIRKDDITIAEALKKNGYHTCIIGKWHLGDTPEYNPTLHGFDYFYGVPYANDAVPFPLYRNTDIIEKEIAHQDTLTKRYTKEALDFIDRSGEDPFFLYFAHTFPHIPLHASREFRGKSRGGLYGDTVEEIDWSVGELLAKLEERGLENNTLVVFTSDNGPWYQGSPGCLRGGKGLTYEGGFRVPTVARWPDRIPPGSVCREMATNIDFFPTCLTIAGVPVPEDRVIDGKSILDLLTGKGKTPHEALYFYHYDRVEAIRVGKWKYHRRRNVYVWPSSLQSKGPWLFDLESDPQERYDVSGTYPTMADRLEAMIVEWEKGFWK